MQNQVQDPFLYNVTAIRTAPLLEGIYEHYLRIASLINIHSLVETTNDNSTIHYDSYLQQLTFWRHFRLHILQKNTAKYGWGTNDDHLCWRETLRQLRTTLSSTVDETNTLQYHVSSGSSISNSQILSMKRPYQLPVLSNIWLKVERLI